MYGEGRCLLVSHQLGCKLCCVGTVTTNLEVVSAQRAAASTGKKDILKRKKRHFEQLSEVLYAALNSLDLLSDSNCNEKTC